MERDMFPSKKEELSPIGFKFGGKIFKRVVLVGDDKSSQAETVSHFIRKWQYNKALSQITLIYDYEHFESRNFINYENLSRLPSIIAADKMENLHECLRDESYKINCNAIVVEDELVARIDKLSLVDFILKAIVYFP